MARPQATSDEKILEAARALFLEKGILATAEEVAARLGISEGTVFHRFKTKSELFRAAMAEQLCDPPWLHTLEERAGRGAIEETLFLSGMQAIEHYRRLLPLTMMSWSNPGACGQHAAALPSGKVDPHPLRQRALLRIGSFFEGEMQRGRMRRHDPEVAARMFVGALENYVYCELLRPKESVALPAEMFLRGMIHLFWNGGAPKASNGARGRLGNG